MKKSLISFILIIFIFSIMGYLLKTPSFENSINADLTKVIYTIDTKFILDGKKLQIHATSFHIGNGYILTCKHAIELKNKKVRSFFGFVNIPVNVTDYKYFMQNKEIELIGSIEDVALFYNKSLIQAPFIKFQNSDYLRTGDKLVLVGNSVMKGVNIKLGIVSRLQLPDPILNLSKETATETFVITNPTNIGDSGGPVFITYRNRYYLIGMVYATGLKLDGYGFAIKSNYLIKVVNKLKLQQLNNSEEK